MAQKEKEQLPKTPSTIKDDTTAREPEVKNDFNTFFQYEVMGSSWASFIFWGWGQTLCSKYFSWKTTRKFNRYKSFFNQ